jgi:nucleotide-binding universal stress UspA family protein
MTDAEIDLQHDRATIVVGVDGSRGAEAALAWAVALAKDVGAEILAIHTVEPPTFIEGYSTLAGGAVVEPTTWEEWMREAHDELQAWVDARVGGAAPWQFRTVHGDVRELVEQADRADALAIVVGRRGRGGLAELVLGSYSHRLVHHLSRPVVVVPCPPADS